MKFALAALALVLAGAFALVWWQTANVAPPAPPPVAQAPEPVAPVVEAPAAEPETFQPTTVETPEGDEKLVFDVKSEGDLFFVLRELGMDDVEGSMAKWAVSRGYPEYDEAGNYLLDQPYQQYNDETLRALADNDDMWAQQLLAKRLVASDPAAAMALYEQAAANGSVYAMQELAQLHYRSTRKAMRTRLPSDDAREALDEALPENPEVSAYAWLVAAERSGWDPSRGASAVAMVSRRLDDAQIASACEMAESIQGQLQSQRDSRGLGAYDITPPPLLVAPGSWGGTTQCEHEEPTYDLSGCQAAEVNAHGTSTDVWICNGDGN